MKWNHRALSWVIVGVLSVCPVAADEAQEPGKAEFLAQKCETCHSVSTQDIAHTGKVEKLLGPDLAGVGDRHEASWMVAYVQREKVGENGKKHLKPFKGTDEELQAIVDWLATLTAETPSP